MASESFSEEVRETFRDWKEAIEGRVVLGVAREGRVVVAVRRDRNIMDDVKNLSCLESTRRVNNFFSGLGGGRNACRVETRFV